MPQNEMVPFIFITLSLFLAVILTITWLIVRARKKRSAAAKQASSSSFKTLEQQLAQCAQALSMVYDEKERTLSMETPHTLWLARVLYQSRSSTIFEISAHPQQDTIPGEPIVGRPPNHARASSLLESVPFCEPILFRAETKYDRLGKRLKINRELQTGDARFDELVYIESDAPDRLIELTLQNPELREYIIQCIERGFSVHIYERDALLKLRQSPPDRSMGEADQLQLSINTLDAMARRLPYVSVMDNGKAPTSYHGLAWVMLMLASILSLFTFAFLKHHHVPLSDDLAKSSMIAAAFGWFGLIPVVILVLRGHSTSFRDVIMWMGLLVFALPVWTFLISRETNAVFDLDPPQEIPAQVKSTWRSGKNNTECNVRFQPQARYEYFSVNIPCKDLRPLRPGVYVTLLIGEGALKEPWLKAWKPR